MEEDADFVYVALEKCSWTLAALVDPASGSGPVSGGGYTAGVYTRPHLSSA
jgi:hypothetical protein